MLSLPKNVAAFSCSVFGLSVIQQSFELTSPPPKSDNYAVL